MAHEEFPEQSAAVILNHDGYRPLVDGKITLRIPVVRFAESVVESVRAKHFVAHVVKVAHHLYNPQIQISAESGTKRSIFRQKNKTKRSKKRLHTTLIKPEQKVNEDLCSGFIVS